MIKTCGLPGEVPETFITAVLLVSRQLRAGFVVT